MLFNKYVKLNNTKTLDTIANYVVYEPCSYSSMHNVIYHSFLLYLYKKHTHTQPEEEKSIFMLLDNIVSYES